MSQPLPADKVRYRPDIDGLRAIAVVPVVLYHAGVSLFGGGFVGVDVFFVISGFLITGLILDDILRGEFSIVRFYERRVRRIFPALFVVMGVCAAVAALVFGPREFAALGDSVTAATLFTSNLLFWRDSGYFAIDSERLPLLHTWSLAVEEQFYLFFPPLLLLLVKIGRARHWWWLIGLAVLSFVASTLMVGSDPTSTFYLLPTRAWELLLGAVLACGALAPVRNVVVRNALAVIGLAMIGASVFAYTAQTPFPGPAALLPTVGTALVIYSGSGGLSHVGRVLGARPLVFVGLISYSLYLWHWPLLVFARYWSIVELTPAAIAFTIAASVVLAVLSWRFVETPFRLRRAFAARRPLFMAAAAAMAVLTVTGLAIHRQRGFIPGLHEQASDPRVPDSPWVRWGRCQQGLDAPARRIQPCDIGAAGVSASFILWGDSHARSVATAVDSAATKFHRAGMLATKAGCSPLLGIHYARRRSCAEFNDRMLAYVKDHPELQTVILAGRWATSAEGEFVGRSSAPVGQRDLVDEYANGDGDAEGMFARGLKRTVAALTGMHRHVILVGQVPEVGYDVPSAVLVARRSGRDVNALIAPSMKTYARRTAVVSEVLGSLADSRAVVVVNPAVKLCDADRCAVTADGQTLYRDDHHLSTYGSRYVAPLFEPVFSAAAASPAVALASRNAAR